MKYISVKEAAAQWGVSIQMVRRYCQNGLIPQVIQENGGWRIPEGTERPNAQKPKAVVVAKPPSLLVRKIRYQKKVITTTESTNTSRLIWHTVPVE